MTATPRLHPLVTATVPHTYQQAVAAITPTRDPRSFTVPLHSKEDSEHALAELVVLAAEHDEPTPRDRDLITLCLDLITGNYSHPGHVRPPLSGTPADTIAEAVTLLAANRPDLFTPAELDLLASHYVIRHVVGYPTRPVRR